MPRPLHERNNRIPVKIQNHSVVGAGPIRRAQHPRPLHAINTRSPTKIQINFVTPVGADRCVGPLSTYFSETKCEDYGSSVAHLFNFEIW